MRGEGDFAVGGGEARRERGGGESQAARAAGYDTLYVLSSEARGLHRDRQEYKIPVNVPIESFNCLT